MKKNLAKKVTLSILAGAMLMTSSVAWAGGYAYKAGDDVSSNATGDRGIAVGYNSSAIGANSIAIGANPSGASFTKAVGIGSISIGVKSNAYGDSSIAIGTGSDIDSKGSVAIGANTKVTTGLNSVALGSGSIANVSDVVSVGHGGESDVGPATRSIINVADVPDWDDKTGENYTYGSYAVNVNTLNEALASVQQQSVDLNNYYNKSETNSALALKANASDVYTKTDADATFVKITNNKISNDGNITFGVGDDETNIVTISTTGITVGSTSTHIDGKGVYVGAHNFNGAKAAMNDDGEVKGVNGTFSGNVTAANFVTSSGINITTELGVLGTQVQANSDAIANKAEKSYVDDELAKKADKSALEAEKTAREQADQDLQTQIDNIGGGAIASINQRLDKTNAKINKVGAGAAALAALHPLEYDPDDKLTFSAGMGNYAGENAAALGAFYRPNEKFMVSLGGTMGNGENMVNLGLSIGLDKPNGYAKLSKRELIQEVNAVKLENQAMKDQLANADERIAKLEALVARLVKK